MKTAAIWQAVDLSNIISFVPEVSLRQVEALLLISCVFVSVYECLCLYVCVRAKSLHRVWRSEHRIETSILAH